MSFRNSQSLQKMFFRFRERFAALFVSPIRRCYWSIQGMQVGSGTWLPRMLVTWPHQVRIGARCTIEEDVFFKFDGIWKLGPAIVIGDGTFIGKGCEFNIRRSLSIGRQCLIASGVRFVDHDHGMARPVPMGEQVGLEEAITVGDDVWIGANAVVLKGVNLGEGSVIAAGAVVTRNVSPFEIWAGVPARKIRERT